MQPLTDHELSIIFESLTQQNQIPNIQAVFEEAYPEMAKKEPEKKIPEMMKLRRKEAANWQILFRSVRYPFIRISSFH